TFKKAGRLSDGENARSLTDNLRLRSVRRWIAGRVAFPHRVVEHPDEHAPVIVARHWRKLESAQPVVNLRVCDRRDHFPVELLSETVETGIQIFEVSLARAVRSF